MMKTVCIFLLLVTLLLAEAAVAQGTTPKQLGGGLVHMKDAAMEEGIKDIDIELFWMSFHQIYNLKIASYDVGSVDISSSQLSNSADINQLSVELEGRVRHQTVYYTYRFGVNFQINVERVVLEFTDSEVVHCRISGLEKKVIFSGYGSRTAARNYNRYGADYIHEAIETRVCDILKAIWAM